MERRRTVLVGVGVFLVALLVRCVGIGWGLPNELRNQSLHPDEPVVFLYSQNIEPAKLDFTPDFYNYGTLYLTLLRVSSDVAASYGAGPKDNSADAEWHAIGRYHLVGRVLSTIAGAATVWLVFLVLFPRVGMTGSLFGAAAMAFAPGHVVHSRFQTVDVLATFFLFASLFCALKLTKSANELSDNRYLKLAAWSGVFAGLSAGTKYTGILALIGLIVVVLMDRRRLAVRAIGLALVMALVVFFLVTPGAITDTQDFMRDFRYEMTHTQTGHGLVFAGTPIGYLHHLTNLGFALGVLLAAIGAVGIARATFRLHSWAVALAAFGLAYFLLIGGAEVKFMRYVFPLLPVLAVGFGWIVARAHIHPNTFVRSAVVFFSILALGGLDGGSAAMSARATAWMAAQDVRDSVAYALKDAAADETTVGLAQDPWFYTVSLYRNVAAGPWIAFEQRMEWMRAARDPQVLRYVPGNHSERFDWDVRLLNELRPDYVAFSSFEIGDINRLRELPSPPSEFKTQLGRAEEFMDTLLTEYEPWLVQGSDGAYLPHDFMYIRPEVQVWKRKQDSQTPSTGSSTTSGLSGEPAPTP